MTNIKSRIKYVFNYKKPVFWISILIVMVIISLGGILVVNQLYSNGIQAAVPIDYNAQNEVNDTIITVEPSATTTPVPNVISLLATPTPAETPAGLTIEETSEPFITPNIVDAYEMVIDDLYNSDKGLNTGAIMNIDTSKMVNLTEEGRRDLLQRASKYGKTVKNLTFNELIEEGNIVKGNIGFQFENGFLITIKDKPFEKDSFTLQAQIWVSGIGAGEHYITMEYKNNQWNLKHNGSIIS